MCVCVHMVLEGFFISVNMSNWNHFLPFSVSVQTKNPGHFTAWSSCLLSHEMYRKTQLASSTATKGHTLPGKGGVTLVVMMADGESLDSWAERTQMVISGVRKGWWVG